MASDLMYRAVNKKQEVDKVTIRFESIVCFTPWTILTLENSILPFTSYCMITGVEMKLGCWGLFMIKFVFTNTMSSIIRLTFI